MKRPWKTLENTRLASPLSRFAQWFVDNENRGFIGWSGSLIGIAFVIAYQMTLEIGFTPQVSLTEGAFVLGKAALIGLFLFAGTYACIFAPAGSLRFLEIDIDRISGAERQSTILALMRRCLLSQIFGAFFVIALFFYSNGDRAHHFYFATIFSMISVVALAFALRTKRLAGEGEWKFRFTIAVIGALAAISLFFFLAFAGMKDDPLSLVNIFLAWVALALVASIVSISRKKDLLSSCGVALLSMLLIFGILDQLPRPFKTIAAAVGIAQEGDMTVIVPPAVCGQIRSALTNFHDMKCTGDEAGILRGVEVLNSWGARWLIQLRRDGSKRIISFDGSGVVMVKERIATPKRQGSDAG